jgi:SAM-dependent methyltransferase
MQVNTTTLKIDLGCGSSKRPGFVGLDYVAGPGVDHVLDLTRDRFPFADNTVSHVFSAHFLEHIGEPNHVFGEISRVCRDGATIEFWTPYAFSNEAFVYGHLTFLTEEPWLQFCCDNRDCHLAMIGGRWLMRGINYVVPEAVERDLAGRGYSVPFAVRYLKSVVQEFGVEMEFRRDVHTPATQPAWTYSHTRFGTRMPLVEPKPTFMQRVRRRLMRAA